MEAPQNFLSCSAAHDSGTIKEAEAEAEVEERQQRTIAAAVDPFLVEALENPRHRLTVLRMELDIQRFMQNSNQNQFEFQHLPTSYLRCAAHRVAQHYGLQTMALENNAIDGFFGKVVARKTPESKYPVVLLSDIPVKQPDNEKAQQVKIVIRPRPNQVSMGAAMESGGSRNLLRTVEERKEEYDKARARIFSAPSSPEVEGGSSMHAADRRSLNWNRGDQEYNSTVSIVEEHDNIEKIGINDGTSSIAIYRDMEKDRSDPDYDRSYDRYARRFVPFHEFNLGTCSVLQPSFLQYEPGFHQIPRTQASVNYISANLIRTPFPAAGCNQTSQDAVYMQWPTSSMVYAQSYDPFRHAVYQAPVYQQPLSFEHWPSR